MLSKQEELAQLNFAIGNSHSAASPEATVSRRSQWVERPKELRDCLEEESFDRIGFAGCGSYTALNYRQRSIEQSL